MSKHQECIEEFMKLAGQEVPQSPLVPDLTTRILRAKLIMEEAYELFTALGLRMIEDEELTFEEAGEVDLIAVADGCADLSVVTIGTLSACGICDDPLLAVVDASNLDKFRGDAHLQDGKWIKPSDWKKPNIEEAIYSVAVNPITLKDLDTKLSKILKRLSPTNPFPR